jgi:rhodanese-related sulfurtransferase
MSISMKTALKLIAQNVHNPKFKVIDVRTPQERAASYIPHSQHVPLADLERSLGTFSKEDTYLVYCRSGVRSVTAATMLNSRGFNAINMEGGILEWEKVKGGEEGEGQPKQGCDIY